MSSVQLSDDELRVPIHFLNRSKTWDTVKPYILQYYPKEDFPRNNLEHSPHETCVRSIRSCAPPPNIDVQGFGVFRLKTAMTYSDFQNDDTILNVYCQEIQDYFKKELGANHVRTLDFQVRRRQAEFPYFEGKLPSNPQPSLLTHVDVTADAAESIVRDLYGDVAEKILGSRYQIITIWRPFNVPVEEWPLAICDARSVQQDDLIPSDILYPEFQAENCMVHFNKGQKWYWLPNQAADEVLVFKAVDTGSSSWPCPHGAFPLPSQGAVHQLRESIDVRILVMYADIEYPK